MAESDELSSLLTGVFASRPDLPVGSAYLFGSRADGRARRESDVDVAVLIGGERGRDRAEAHRLRVEITSELIGALHHNEVDLVVLDQAPPLFARAIITSGRRVFCRDPAADRDFVRDVQLKAADLEPFVERGRQRVLETLAS